MNPSPFYITGIGASADGIHALKIFFENIEDKPGTAFVIIQHLAPEQKGFTKEILKEITSIPIVQVEGDTKVQIDHIYLIPPANFLVLEDQHLILKPRSSRKKVNDAIDVFFQSLAQQASDKAVGIILSGLGSDGAKGVQLIKERGGIVMVQSPETANFSSMPLEAIMSDHPDVIGSPEKIAKDLIHFINHPSAIPTDTEHADEDEKDVIEKVISLVNEFSGVNFRDYKKNTILRRIDKRLKINYKNSIEEYFKFLTDKPDEIRVLYNDLLIGVTEFFRDKEAFELLDKKVIPELCGGKKEFTSIRIWVAGCSTGEEAYSVAMLLDKYIKANSLNLDFKIFATDLDQKAIELARYGKYSKHIESQIPAPLLNDYFVQRGDFYEIINDLRKKIIFSVHNLLTDPPFIRMDLITCRNLFIYLNGEVQKKILYTFNYALKDKGYLMIGAHESQADLIDLFETIDYRWKIFKNKSNQTHAISNIIRPATMFPQGYPETKLAKRANPIPVDQQQEFFAELLLEKYAPACILLTEKNEVLYATGDAELLLTFPKRRSNLNLFEMVSGSTALALRNGLRKVRESNRNVVLRNVNTVNNNQEKVVADFFFYSIFSKRTSQKYVIVEVKPGDIHEDNQEFMEISTRENLKEIERLEIELEQARKELQFNSDELEIINEELQSSNEEMKSSNEEMQTTNEELQSSNEELKTVNFELKSKIEEITVLHDDVQNLFISTQIATLFLDRDLNIRKFTPAVQSYFNIRESDIGRPIYHYTYNFVYPNLDADVGLVLQTLQPLRKEIDTNRGYALIKVIPYKTDDRRIEGVILTIVDVNEMKEANLKLQEMAQILQTRSVELEQSEKSWQSLVENTPDIVAKIDENATILYVNQSLSKFGFDPGAVIGTKLPELGKKDTGINHLNKKIQEVLTTKQVVNFYQNFNWGGKVKNSFITLIPEWNGKEEGKKILLIARDITALRSVENKLEEKNKRLNAMNQYMDSFVHAVAHDLRSPITNLKLILTLISDEQSPEKIELVVGKLDHAVSRIDDILNGLIELIDSHVNISEKERSVNFKSVIDKVLEQFNNDIPKDTHINLHIETEEINHIRGYVFSIIRNLLSNCIKFRKNDVPLTISIETKDEGEYKVLSVEDNGIGMDFDDVKNDLFKPFKRLTSGGEGKGLGLHLIRSMVEKTGGKIEVDSEEGRGSKFYVYFKDLRT